MQPVDIAAREAASWWFESTRGHHCRCDAIGRHRCFRSSVSGGSNPLTGTISRRDATGRHRYLKSSVLVVRIHSPAPCRCDAIGRHRCLRSSVSGGSNPLTGTISRRDATGRHRYLKSSVLVVRIHSPAPRRCDAIGRHRYLRSSAMVVRIHSPAAFDSPPTMLEEVTSFKFGAR